MAAEHLISMVDDDSEVVCWLHDHLDQTWTSIFHSACELPSEFFNRR